MFKPIPKAEWDKMSDDEKNWANLEYQKDKAASRHKILMFTRVVALALIGFIFYLWYSQIAYVQDVSEIRREYGNDYACYLCGKENLKQCECTYNRDYFRKDFDRENFSLYLAEYNTQACKPLYLYNDSFGDLSNINFSSFSS